MTEPVTIARYFPWDGGAIFLGTAGVIPAHAHQAIQICFLFEGRILLRRSNEETWVAYDVAIVPSQQRHAMDGSQDRYGATIFVEPETREGRVLAKRYLSDGIADVARSAIASVLPGLLAAARQQRGGTGAAIVEQARRLVQALTGHEEPAVRGDERILRAIRYVNEHLAAPLTLKQVAGAVFLSPGRFRHLFAEQTGMGLRQYILWRRFTSVWELRMQGASLSTAAHAAGFADSAHLTRTSRRMFGFPPSSMDISPASRD